MLEKIERQSGIFGKFLYFFAGYTLTIKYILPVSWALIQRVSLTTYIYFWDAWWIAHLLVGYGLAAGKKGIWGPLRSDHLRHASYGTVRFAGSCGVGR